VPATAAAPAAPAAISKSQAVREALAAGIEKPDEAIQWIRENYGLEMTPTHFSAVKANDKRRGIGGKSGDELAAAKVLKPLIHSYGVEKVKEMADLWS